MVPPPGSNNACYLHVPPRSMMGTKAQTRRGQAAPLGGRAPQQHETMTAATLSQSKLRLERSMRSMTRWPPTATMMQHRQGLH